MNQRNGPEGRNRRGETPTPAFAPAGEEMSPPPELQGKSRNERERIRSAGYEEEAYLSDASSDEENKPGAVAVPGVIRGPSQPARAPSVISQPSLIVAELAEPSQQDEALRRRNQDLERIVGEAVTATVIVENKGRRLLIGAALALVLVVGVILGVTIPLTTGTNGVTIPKDAPPAPIDPIPAPVNPTSIDPVVTPTQSPTNPDSDRLKILREILLQNEVSGAEALQDDTSPQSRALRWLADEDPALLELGSTPTGILVARYVLVLLFFATNGEGWSDQFSFLSASSVCEWNNVIGVGCNENDLIVLLRLCKSKHE
jgi:hypothetical protein